MLESSKKTNSKAPQKTPQKQWWKTVFEVVGLLVWVGLAVIAAQFAVGYLMIAFFGSNIFEQPVMTAIFSALYYSLALFLIIFLPPKLKDWFYARKGKTVKKQDKEKQKLMIREKLGLKGLPTWTDVGLSVVGFIVYLLIAGALSMLFTKFGWFDANEEQDVGFNILISHLDRLVAFLTLVIIAPIAEEIIFRGWLYERLRTKLSLRTTKAVAIILSTLLVSLLFGLVHGQWNVGINVFAMSLVLCGLREVTGTIYAGILLHMIKNGIAFYLLYIMGLGL